jgi:hypothetical protein
MMGGYGGLLLPSHMHLNSLRHITLPISEIQSPPHNSINLPFQYPDHTAPQIFDDVCSQSFLNNFAPRALAENHIEQTFPKSIIEDIPILYEAGAYLPGVIPKEKNNREGGNGAGWNSDGTNEGWADFDLMEFSNGILHNDTTFVQGNETLGFSDIGEMDMAALPNYFDM